MPANGPPCPQAAAAPTIGPGSLNPLQYAIEANPAQPRPDSAPIPQPVLPTRLWPYHLPRWVSIDVLWWAMLARAAYFTDDTWVRRVAQFSGDVLRLDYRAPTNPAVQGRALVELRDCWLCIIPGTSSELELFQYVLSHGLENTTQDTIADWRINSTWHARANPIWEECLTWGVPEKPLIAIGHSSGGAYAAYVAFKADQITPEGKLCSVATFGSPIWGTPSMVNWQLRSKTPQVIEFTTTGDPIPWIPPPWSMIDALRLVYPVTPRPIYFRVGSLLEIRGTPGLQLQSDRQSSDQVFQAAYAVIAGGINAAAHATLRYVTKAQDYAAFDTAWTDEEWIFHELEKILDEMPAFIS